MSDHREIAQAMDLFHFEEHSPGMVFWHPMGFRVFRELENYMRKVHERYGYNEIRTPMMLSRQLWEKSGHWEKFRENMFLAGGLEQIDDLHGHPTEVVEQRFSLKPMSCPAHIAVYGSTLRSYRDLPFRYFEFGVVHRNEASGALNGCMRLRQFTQDDAHLFCTDDQILAETSNYIRMVEEVYQKFGFANYTVKLATRPEQRVGSDDLWTKAEKALADACDTNGLPYTVSPGEGAFYGPKLEFTLQDSLGRDWQCGTIQVDFNLTGEDRLDVDYVDQDNIRKHPVLIHHAVLGSLERWVGILLENDSLPFWLNPVQAVVASISEGSANYAERVAQALRDNHVRVEADTSNWKISQKIKHHTLRKVPYLLIVGNKESEDDTVAIRRPDGSQETIQLADLLGYFWDKM